MSIQPIPPSTGPTTAGQLAARATQNDQALAAWLGDVEDRVETLEYGSGTSGSSNLLVVSGSVTLDDGVPVGSLVGYRVTSSATFTGQGGSVTLGAGAHVFERVTGGWEYRTLAEGTGLTPPVPDTTSPNAGTLTVTGVTDVAATLTVSGASDNQALHAAPYRFSTNAGSTWTAYQAAAVHTPTLTPSTTYQPRVMVRDAAGNTATATAADFTTASAPLPTGPVSVTHLYSGANAATTAAQSYSAVPLGAAHQNRLIVVASVARRSASRTINSATIGGVPATTVNTGNGAYSLNFAYAVVPTGTTGDITLTFSGGLDQGGSVIDVFEVANTVKTHSASVSTANRTVTVVPASPTGGLVLLYAARPVIAPFAMTGGTEVIDYQATDFGQVAAYWTAATGADVTFTATNTPTPGTAAITFDKAV